MNQVEIYGDPMCARTRECATYFYARGVRVVVVDCNPGTWGIIELSHRAPGCKIPAVFLSGKLVGDECDIRAYDTLRIQQMVGGI